MKGGLLGRTWSDLEVYRLQLSVYGRYQLRWQVSRMDIEYARMLSYNCIDPPRLGRLRLLVGSATSSLL